MKNLLKNKLFLILFANDLLSNFGDVLYYLALMSYVLQLPDAKVAIALVSVSESLPILTGFVMGHVADRTLDKLGKIFHTLLFRVGLYSLVGIVMGFQPALWVVMVAAAINFFSDLAGQYENGLYIPLSLRIVADEDREASYSFKQAVGFVTAIGFQSLGAVFVSVMSYQALAFVNAGTFLLSAGILFLIKSPIQALLSAKPILVQDKQEGENLARNLWRSMKEAVEACLSIPELRQSIVLTPLLNGLFNILSILIAVIISQDKQFVLINPATTLAAISVAQLLGGILGSVLGMNALKSVSIGAILRSATLLVPFLFLCLYQHWLYGLFFLVFLALVLAAAVNPKMNALILNSLPEEKLALISGGIGTYFQLGSLVLRLIVSGLILFLPVEGVSLVFGLVGVCMIIYAYKGRKSS
ncbi:MFS transporter [Streptococcus caprae]|uniref:MFS transporter n=1 Tax=Streptococcus caprae TaxID=1640501 RepID=A0ABV8CTA6_9STRE